MILMKQIVYLFLLVFINSVQFISTAKSEPNYHQYLQQFGYTPKAEGRLLLSSVVGKPSYQDGIKKFQRLFKLPETGELDESTRKLMQRPRCGNPDLNSVNFVKRPNNKYRRELSFIDNLRSIKVRAAELDITETVKWSERNLKWRIDGYPKQQKLLSTKADIDRIITEAFNDWEKYSGLTFQMVKPNEKADLKINFHSKDHNDGYPFDGPGATLAHAFYPTSGEIHFDDDEHFTDNYNSSIEQYTLRLVATHEIGHALGLPHFFEEDSLMFPAYQQFSSNFIMSEEDQRRIQRYYGTPDTKVVTASTQLNLLPTLPTRSPDITQNNNNNNNNNKSNNWCLGEFQTGCEGPDGELYLIKDNQIWKYFARAKHTWDTRPRSIKTVFPTVTDKTITACVKSITGYTYLFNNNRIWKAQTHWSVNGPHVIAGRNFPQNPHIALFHQNSIYLIRNRSIYRLHEFDSNRDLEIHSINTILNPPPNEKIRTGFTYAQHHYIFTNDLVYVYDSTDGNLLSGYPKSRTNGWFACESSSSAQQLKKKPKLPSRKDNEQENRHNHHRHRHHHDGDGHNHHRHRQHHDDDDHHHHHDHQSRREHHHHHHHK